MSHALTGLVTAAALAGAGVAAVRFWRLSALAAAYKAKVLCTAVFGSGLTLEPNRAPEVSDEAYRPMRLFRARVDRQGRRVSVSAPGRGTRVAVHRPGLGATLALGPLVDLPVPPPGPAAAPWPDAPESTALERVVEGSFAEPDRRHLRRTRAVLIARHGRILAERYADGIGPDTPLPGWSMTKAVMGTLIGVLVGEGKLSVSSKKLLPEWSAPGDPRAGIALEDLLRMRSGLRFREVYSDPASDVSKMLFMTPDAGGYAASLPLERRPGELWKYSSGTSNILSLIARRALGDAAYAALPRRALFDPLGMASAVIEPDASGTFVASSYMLATARDWARFGRLCLEDGVHEGRRLLPEGWMRFSTTVTPQSGGRYGAQWWLKLNPELGGGTPAEARLPDDAFHALGHEGQCLTMIPSLGLIVVRLGLSIRIDAWDHAAFLAAVLDTLR